MAAPPAATIMTMTMAVLVACGGKPEPAAKVAVARDGGAIDAGLGDAAVDAAPGFAPRPASADEEAAVQAFVERWLATQNPGDFAAYQALYGDPFRGVRRTGAATRRFDRAGWMADRKGMFRKPMTVTAGDLVVYVAGPERQVFFTQTWSQGRFRDVGTKNLVLTGAGVQTRIRYEELLGSRIEPTAPPPVVAASGDTWYGYDRAATLATMRLAPVVAGEVTLAATDRDLAPIALTVTEAVRDPAAGGFGAGFVRGALAADDPLRALIGQPVVVLDLALAEACRGTLTEVVVEVSGESGDAFDDEAALGGFLWRTYRPNLIATLAAPCTGAYVRGVDAPALAAITDANGLELAAVKRFGRGLADAGAEVTAVGAIDDGVTGFALYTVERADGCDAPEQHERVLASATRTAGGWTLTEVARLEGTALALMVVDLDGDGALDAVVDGGVHLRGRFDLWTPELFIPWPAGLGCDGSDGE